MDEQTSAASQNRFDQQGQTVHGSQTNIAGNVQGSVLSGQFHGPVTITEVSIAQAQHEQLGDAVIAPAAVFERIQVERFVGREWLVAEVDDFLRGEKCGYFVLEAEAGLGKTAFMAWLARSRNYPCLFCEDAAGLENVGKALKSLAAQLVLTYRLAPWADAGILPPAAERPDVFYKLLTQAAEAARRGQPKRQVVLVIDALDQAGTPEKQNVLSLPHVLPEGVFILAAQRPTSIDLDVDAPLNVIQLSASQADNQDDMRRFLKTATEWPGISLALQHDIHSRQQLIDILMAKCGGVWIYLHHVLHEIERGDRTLSQLRRLPDGIVKYYLEYWRQERTRDDTEWYGLSLPVLATLTAAPDPVTARQLCVWAKAAGQVSQAQRRLNEDWGPFISAAGDDRQPRYRFYHATLRDFFAGQVDRRGLPKAARGFIEELRQATIAALYHVFRTTSAQEEKRRYALQLVRWQGLNGIEDSPTDEFLEILELVVELAYAAAERRYLIDSIDAVLDLSAGALSKRHRARLFVYRAGLYGNLGAMDDAAGSYQLAEAALNDLINSEAAEPEDLKFSARIKRGRGLIATTHAESSDNPGDEAYRATLEEARSLLLEATQAAIAYRKDPILAASTLKELCWAHTLLGDWPQAEEAFQLALQVLGEAQERERSDSCRAMVLETAGCMYWEKAGMLAEDAPTEYQKAFDLATEQIRILERAAASEHLVAAYINWGEYGLAVDQMTGVAPPQHLAKACEYWRAAVAMAQMLGSPKLEAYASQLLEQHCAGSAFGAAADAART